MSTPHNIALIIEGRHQNLRVFSSQGVQLRIQNVVSTFFVHPLLAVDFFMYCIFIIMERQGVRDDKLEESDEETRSISHNFNCNFISISVHSLLE